MTRLNVLTLCLSFFIFMAVVEMVRREKLTFKYAFAWLFFSFLGVVFSIFPPISFFLARILGFELPSNFLFFSIIGMFVFLSLLLTVFLCQLSRRNDRMAQKIGMLEEEIMGLKEKAKGH